MGFLYVSVGILFGIFIGIFMTILNVAYAMAHGMLAMASVKIKVVRISEESPIVLYSSVECTGVNPVQEVEYAEDMSLMELQEHLEQLDSAREVLQEYIEEYEWEDDDDESFEEDY